MSKKVRVCLVAAVDGRGGGYHHLEEREQLLGLLHGRARVAQTVHLRDEGYTNHQEGIQHV